MQLSGLAAPLAFVFSLSLAGLAGEARAQRAVVEAEHGMVVSVHEIAAQVANAKKLEAERAAATSRAGAPPPSGLATGSLPPSRPAIAIGTPNGQPFGLSLPSPPDKGLGLSTGAPAPSRLGGPKAPENVSPAAAGSGSKTEFLRAAHASACRVFGTVLGPEANAAHRNHFHVDMAERKIKSICE